MTGCAYEELELHLMAGADHRMLDRLDHVWRLMRAYLVRRGLVNDPGQPSMARDFDGGRVGSPLPPGADRPSG